MIEKPTLVICPIDGNNVEVVNANVGFGMRCVACSDSGKNLECEKKATSDALALETDLALKEMQASQISS